MNIICKQLKINTCFFICDLFKTNTHPKQSNIVIKNYLRVDVNHILDEFAKKLTKPEVCHQ